MFYSKNLMSEVNLKHCFFSRKNGVSSGIYESLNCGIGSNDDISNVKKNLEIVSKVFDIESNKLALMNQSHSNKVLSVENVNNSKRFDCDALLTKNDDIALCVLTADCAPILIYEVQNKIVGCIHAGWKGAFSGIIENTILKLSEMGGDKNKLIVTVGPCISQNNYEVKKDFYSNFISQSKQNEKFFEDNGNESFRFNLRAYINKKFKDLGVQKIDNIAVDSFASKNEYFSHRRAKKLGEDDYGRCISAIRKTTL
ncbi:MAG: hypothetical protein CBD56_03020 [Candidatus Pelagibacter sp. TMED196]|nr:MAG: hypothetical protein CBD56_03020 [Candidatus Pelagibacter sp. TMED196]|tara:strand:- start:511 stop:1275 length:765 start_codon:yes stop_codon:yes gene_type:complete